MNQEEFLFARFSPQAIRSGGELYFYPSDAQTFLREAEALDFAVAGLEAFDHVEGKLRPRLDRIADYSAAPTAAWEEYRRDTHLLAQSWLKALSGDEIAVVNITVLSRAEWEG